MEYSVRAAICFPQIAWTMLNLIDLDRMSYCDAMMSICQFSGPKYPHNFVRHQKRYASQDPIAETAGWMSKLRTSPGLARTVSLVLIR